MSAKTIPVTILTGFLGSGKTTLLNRILSEHHGQRVAVIENEFGEVGVDHELVINTDEEIFEMNNGCICCTVRGDLIRILQGLLKRRDRFDRILIETTGLADPGPVVQTFCLDEDMQLSFHIDAVVTVVDARHVGLHWEDSREVREQIAFADVILLNKTDLVSADELDRLEKKVRGMNALARIHRCVKAEVPLQAVLDVGAFDLERILQLEPDFLQAAARGHGHDHEHDHEHEEGHEDVHKHAHESEHDHVHDSSVVSVGIAAPGECDGRKLNTWLGRLLQEQGQDIFRMKGVFAVKGHAERIVLQGVHMWMQGDRGRAWAEGEERRNLLVFIGRHLNRQSLEEGFRSCLV